MTYCKEIADKIWDVFMKYMIGYTTMPDGMKITMCWKDNQKYEVYIKPVRSENESKTIPETKTT